MADTIMADTIMADTIMQDTIMQDADMQDTTTQDTVVLDLVRKVAKMKKLRKNVVKPYVREDLWKPTETFHLLHLYTINSNNTLQDEKGRFNYGQGVIASLVREMMAESVKHHPGGLLHASDPWFPRTYNERIIRYKLRLCLIEEDDLAVELEAELNAHYSIVPDPAAKQPSQVTVERRRRALAKELKQQPKVIITEEAIQEAERMLGEEQVRNANQTLRLEFKKVRKPVIIDKTDA
ncbi:hypothetical protein BCON_0308g00010 [Botryotinia convoluta]|uniref:Uncharacterized protein n=1 Tax=Botryotinia convoluta TaxID=54673 RepID=A0A4Z1HEG6_9HELO|nr:hypothetical protein BCON_0308g00010 [Botryotinia convoluta]